MIAGGDNARIRQLSCAAVAHRPNHRRVHLQWPDFYDVESARLPLFVLPSARLVRLLELRESLFRACDVGFMRAAERKQFSLATKI